MKIKDLVAFFPQMKIISGEDGANNTVTTVSVMDAPDIDEWMKGGEFLITSGYVIKQNFEDFNRLFSSLIDKKIAALGIKLDRFNLKIPKEILKLSDKEKLPIVYIPPKYSFADIINPALTHIASELSLELQKSSEIHKEFMLLGITDNTIEDILSLLEFHLKKKAYYYDKHDKKWYQSEGCLEIEPNDEKNIIKNSYMFEVKLKNMIYGKLYIESEETISNFENQIIDHSITMINLRMQSELVRTEVENNYRKNLIEDICFNNCKSAKEIKNRAILHHWKFTPPFEVVIFDIDNYKIDLENQERISIAENQKHELFNTISNILKKDGLKIYTFSKNDYMTVLVESPIKNDIKIFQKIQKLIKDKFGYTITISIGEKENEIEHVFRSFFNAKDNIHIGRSLFGDGNILYHDQMITYKLLWENYKRGAADFIYLRKLKKLKYIDKKRNTEYYKTLEAYIDNGFNMKKASDKLYIHYNTMKQRMNTINELIEFNYSDMNKMVLMTLSLRFDQMNRGINQENYKR